MNLDHSLIYFRFAPQECATALSIALSEPVVVPLCELCFELCTGRTL